MLCLYVSGPSREESRLGVVRVERVAALRPQGRRGSLVRILTAAMARHSRQGNICAVMPLSSINIFLCYITRLIIQSIHVVNTVQEVLGNK
jgi:hypothetical protein